MTAFEAFEGSSVTALRPPASSRLPHAADTMRQSARVTASDGDSALDVWAAGALAWKLRTYRRSPGVWCILVHCVYVRQPIIYLKKYYSFHFSEYLTLVFMGT